jgi:hypothetical protein
LIFGLGMILAAIATVAFTLSLFFFVVAATTQRPRVVITAEGFVVHKLLGAESRKWEDVDGRFAVIKIGWSAAVAYNLTPEYKTRIGKKRTSLFSGYDAAVSGAFKLSAEELAALLNEHKQPAPASPVE